MRNIDTDSPDVDYNTKNFNPVYFQLKFHRVPIKCGDTKEFVMDDVTLKICRRWFVSYTANYRDSDPDRQRNIDLKIEHTMRVCSEIRTLGKHLGLEDNDMNTAEATALFHDIGRFEQFRRFGTYNDRISVNHGELGASILEKGTALDNVDTDLRELIITTTRCHNRLQLPEDETPRCAFFTRLLRDADKLDIWRVVIDYHTNKRNGGAVNRTIELDLPDGEDISDDVYRSLMQDRFVDFTLLKNQNDFKIAQIGWIYDINFTPTLHEIMSRRYLTIVRSFLPRTPRAETVINAALGYLLEKTGMNTGPTNGRLTDNHV